MTNQVKRYELKLYESFGQTSYQLVSSDDGDYVCYSDYEKLRAEKEALELAHEELIGIHKNVCERAGELSTRVAHLEALLVAVREEDAKAFSDLMGFLSRPSDQSAIAKTMRELPLPDKRAERIRDVVEVAKRANNCICEFENDLSCCAEHFDALYEAVRALEAE